MPSISRDRPASPHGHDHTPSGPASVLGGAHELAEAQATAVHASPLPLPELAQPKLQDGRRRFDLTIGVEAHPHVFAQRSADDRLLVGRTLAFNGGVRATILGAAGKVVTSGARNGGFYGPVLTFTKGDRAQVAVRAGKLDRPTNVHLHGFAGLTPDEDVFPPSGLFDAKKRAPKPAQGDPPRSRRHVAGGMAGMDLPGMADMPGMDHGGMSMPAMPGMGGKPKASASVTFDVENEAGVYWGHPHEHGSVAREVATGGAFLVLVKDQRSKRLDEAGLPHTYGRDLVPFMLSDFRLKPDQRVREDEVDDDGTLGDRGGANGVVTPTFEASTAINQFLLLNAAPTRIMKIGLVDETDTPVPFHVIASECGLLNQAAKIESLLLAPGERAAILVDLEKHRGRSLKMVSFEFDVTKPAEGTLSYKNAHEVGEDEQQEVDFGRPPQGYGMELAELIAPKKMARAKQPLEKLLAAVGPLNEVPKATDADTANRGHPFVFQLEGPPDDGKDWAYMINGERFDPGSVAMTVEQGKKYVIRFDNPSDMPHPMHWHGAPIRVLERKRLDGTELSLSPTDQGLKDTVLVAPGESAEIVLDATTQPPGKYMMHCHNLMHEDGGMMFLWEITPPAK